ncbi:MAG: hypothetical protein NTZ01_06800 [Verrucomicrobia bacterium]|nr:hypothetical protein [Verrucomicrobiota bacterium]
MALGGIKNFLKYGIASEGAIADGEIDPSQFLINDAASPEIEMTDLRVSHLPFRQAHLKSARLKPRTRVVGIELVMDWGPREEGGIALTGGARFSRWVDPPTIANEKQDRFLHGMYISAVSV